uniref:recombinase family protein n=1 Tax=Streptococcus suis TaxID=1307 RepID=UPI003756DC2E
MARRKTRMLTQKQEAIRQAFENERFVEVIPAKREFTDTVTKKLRVAAYCRVSTFDESQSGSFELQKQTYLEKINNHPDWELAGIYADQGTSGTTIKKREQFQLMLEDCRKGKIDLIVVKSVSRFARNQLDFIGTCRELKSLPHPVGIYIEDINLNTLDTNSEFILGVMSIVAQGESEQKSASITWSVIERFKRGIPIIPTHNLLGYSKDQYGRIIIDKDEAKVVKYIYNAFINGQSKKEIAESLMANHIPTVTGLEVWTSTAVNNILRNEKYKGEILMQKTFTVDCFTHKVRKNNGEKPQYRLKNGLPSIISESEWNLVQQLLSLPRRKSKSTNKVAAPKILIKTIKSGMLRDFVVLDPNWNRKDIQAIFRSKGE